MALIQGTTPTISFSFDLDWDSVSQLTATFEHKDKECLKLTKDRFSYDDNTITSTLTQEEALSLPIGYVKTQLKIKDNDNKVFASNIVQVRVSEILDEVVL